MWILCSRPQTVSLGRFEVPTLTPGNLDVQHAAQVTLMQAGRDAHLAKPQRRGQNTGLESANVTLGVYLAESVSLSVKGAWESLHQRILRIK